MSPCAACDYTDNSWCPCECHDGEGMQRMKQKWFVGKDDRDKWFALLPYTKVAFFKTWRKAYDYADREARK